MLLQFFKRRLRLEVGERRLTFDSIADFEFALSSRTEVPASKVAALVKLTAPDLRREATKIRVVEKRFVNIFSRSLEEPGNISRLMHELGHKVFSLDHEWRLIIAALNQQTAEFGEYKKMALVKYLQYLGSRQDVLKSIYADKLERGAVDNPDESSQDFKETVIFELSRETPTREDTSQFERLPKGETVAIRFKENSSIELMLSSNRFKLTPGKPLSLVDEDGNHHAVKAGKNYVGRDAKNEVVINARFRDVSRTHFIIEPYGSDTALVTALSSHGTFVPIKSLQSGLTSSR